MISFSARMMAACILLLLPLTTNARLLFTGAGGNASAAGPVVQGPWIGQVNSNGVGSLTATRSSGTIGAGDCVLVLVNDGGTPTVTDNAGHTYSAGPANSFLRTYYLLNATAGGSTITVADSGNSVAGVEVDEYSNCGTSLDTSGASATGTSAALNSGNITTAVSGDLIWGAGLTNSSTTGLTPGGGFTGQSAAPTGTGATISTGAYTNGSGTYRFSTETESQVQSSSGAVSASFAASPSDTWWAAVIAVTPFGYTPTQTIASIAPTSCTIATGATGTCATMAVTMAPASPAFSGSLALAASGGSCSGGDTTDFTMSGSNLNLTNSSLATGSYTACVRATQAGISNSPKTQAVAITVTTAGSGTLTLTNGPPNIAYAGGGSCTTITCTWIQSGVSGEAVSDVYFDASPISANPSVTFSLSGPQASNYSISQTTYSDYYGSTRPIGHIVTASSLSAGDDDVTVNANGVSQRLTVHKVGGTTTACSQSGLASASGSAGNGGIILIPSGCNITLSSTFQPSANNQIFIGAGWAGSGAGGSTISNTGQNPGIGPVGGATGISFMNMELAGNYSGTGNPEEALQTSAGWVVRNIYSHDNSQGLSAKACPNWFLNNRMIHNSYNGIAGVSTGDASNCVSPTVQTLIGNEWAFNNFGGNDGLNDAGQKWITYTFSYTLNVSNSYVHDNYESSLWSDSNSDAQWNIYQNTFLGNGCQLQVELSGQNGGQFNFYQNFFRHNSDGTNSCSDGSGGSYSNDSQISLGGGSCCINMYNNNFVIDGGSDAWRYSNEGSGAQNSVVAHDNTVNFLSSTPPVRFGGADIFYNPTALNPSGTAAYHNAYHMVGGSTSDAHFNWFQSGNGAFTFAQWQAAGAYCDGSSNCSYAAPDSAATGAAFGEGAGTADTSSSFQGVGCTHVACSSAGVGSGGVPQ